MSFQAVGRSVRARAGRLAAQRVAKTAAARVEMVVQSRLAAATPARAFSVLQSAVGSDKSFQPQLAAARAFSSAAAEPVPVPSMGDSISEGTVVEWLKVPGDFVEADDVVVVLETDKVSVDVRAPFSGVLEEQLAKIDDNVLVGTPLFSVVKQASSGTPAASAPAPAAETPVAPAAAAGPADLETINVPAMGDSISEGTVVTFLKHVGDYVNADESVLVIETDKVSVDVNAPFSGKLTSVLAKLDEVVQVGSPLFVLDKAAAPSASTPAVEASTPAPATPATPAASTPAPAAKAAPAPSTPAPAAASAAASVEPVGRFRRNETRVQMSALKVRAAQRQKDTQNSAAMLSTFQECDLGNLLALREELGDSFEKAHGVKLGFMSAFLKASAQALKQVPAVNSFMDMDANELILNDFVDINVSVASERGVVSPVIRDVENLSIPQIEKALAALSQQARDGTLAVEDLAGGTFSVNNSGVFGSLLSTSMLTSPQSAVLGVHSVQMRPGLLKGELVPRPMMYLSLTYDHRIIDGREGVTFLKSIADAVSDPRRLLMDF